jgi:hydrogenase nickel incorporation protein HypB
MVVVSKMDLAKACDYNRTTVMANVRRLAPKAQLFEVSAKTNEGMKAWIDFLLNQHQRLKQLQPSA